MHRVLHLVGRPIIQGHPGLNHHRPLDTGLAVLRLPARVADLQDWPALLAAVGREPANRVHLLQVILHSVRLPASVATMSRTQRPQQGSAGVPLLSPAKMWSGCVLGHKACYQEGGTYCCVSQPCGSPPHHWRPPPHTHSQLHPPGPVCTDLKGPLRCPPLCEALTPLCTCRLCCFICAALSLQLCFPATVATYERIHAAAVCEKLQAGNTPVRRPAGQSTRIVLAVSAQLLCRCTAWIMPGSGGRVVSLPPHCAPGRCCA